MMLKNDISVSAKMIWQLLLDYGMLSMAQICKISHFPEDTVTQAIDWLEQENKIKIVEKEKVVYAELSGSSFSEMRF
jgi:Protein of unknown function (DUF2582).